MPTTWKEEVAKRKRRSKAEPSANGHAKKEDTAADIEPRNVTLAAPESGPFPDEPSVEAFAGLAGELVDLVDPHTESSRVAVLVQALVAFGSLIGPGPHFKVEKTKHALNLFAVMVGNTAKGRKGTSWNRVREPFRDVDLMWADEKVKAGLSSGEGLIWEVRDPVIKLEKISEKGRVPGWEEIEVDKGIADKRLLIVESEFCNVLKQGERQGNILSATLRQAWESGDLRTMSRNSPAKATGAHISIIGHVTMEELRRYLSSTEAASGFGNRFLWVAVRRSKLLPEGGREPDIAPIVNKFKAAASFAACVHEIPRDEEARELWHEVYPHLSREIPGLVGALCARAEAQTMRLACLYALLDLSHQVELRHLRSALSLWYYCERSTSFVFGLSTGDHVADEILAALKAAKDGMSRTDIFLLLQKNQTRDRIGRALLVLEQYNLATRSEEKTKGRPIEMWKAGGTH